MKEKLKLIIAVLPKGAMAYMGVIFLITAVTGLVSMPLSSTPLAPVAMSAIGGVFGRIVINIMLKVTGLGLPFSEDWGRFGIALGTAIVLAIA